MENSINVTERDSSNLERTVSPITVDELKPHMRNQSKQQAQIRCSVYTTYPEAQIGNSLNNSVFEDSDFDIVDGQTYEEKRVAWMDVPAGLTKEQVQAKLNQFKSATIFRVLSLEPILTSEQVRAMERGISEYTDTETGEVKKCDMEYYRRRQMIPTPETMSLPESQRQPLKWNGHVQYRITGFDRNGREDVDYRQDQLNQMTQSFKMNEGVQVHDTAQKVSDGF